MITVWNALLLKFLLIDWIDKSTRAKVNNVCLNRYWIINNVLKKIVLRWEERKTWRSDSLDRELVRCRVENALSTTRLRRECVLTTFNAPGLRFAPKTLNRSPLTKPQVRRHWCSLSGQCEEMDCWLRIVSCLIRIIHCISSVLEWLWDNC